MFDDDSDDGEEVTFTTEVTKDDVVYRNHLANVKLNRASEDAVASGSAIAKLPDAAPSTNVIPAQAGQTGNRRKNNQKNPRSNQSGSSSAAPAAPRQPNRQGEQQGNKKKHDGKNKAQYQQQMRKTFALDLEHTKKVQRFMAHSQRHLVPFVNFGHPSILTRRDSNRLLAMTLEFRAKGKFAFKGNRKWYEEALQSLQPEFTAYKAVVKRHYAELYRRNPFMTPFTKRPPAVNRSLIDTQINGRLGKPVVKAIFDGQIERVKDISGTSDDYDDDRLANGVAITESLQFDQILCRIGRLPRALVPDMSKRASVEIGYEKIQRFFLPDRCARKWDISDDPNVKPFAQMHGADAVFPACTLRQFLIPPTQAEEWAVAFRVTPEFRNGVRGKSVEFDKPLPRGRYTNKELLEKYYKRALQAQLVHINMDLDRLERLKERSAKRKLQKLKNAESPQKSSDQSDSGMHMSLGKRARLDDEIGALQRNSDDFCFGKPESRPQSEKGMEVVDYVKLSPRSPERPEPLPSKVVENSNADGAASLPSAEKVKSVAETASSSETENLLEIADDNTHPEIAETKSRVGETESSSDREPNSTDICASKPVLDHDTQSRCHSQETPNAESCTPALFDPSELLKDLEHLAPTSIPVLGSHVGSKVERGAPGSGLETSALRKPNPEMPTSTTSQNPIAAPFSSAKQPPLLRGLLSYSIWNFVDTGKAYRLLVRSKMEGELNTKGNPSVAFVPKIEFLSEFGGQAMSEADRLKLYATCLLKRTDQLFVGHLHPLTGEILSFDLHRLPHLARSLGRNVSCAAHASLAKVLNETTQLPDGTYVMRHAPFSPNIEIFRTIANEPMSVDLESENTADSAERLNSGENIQNSNHSDSVVTQNLGELMKIDCLTPIKDKFCVHLDFDSVYQPIDELVILQYHRLIKKFPATFDLRDAEETTPEETILPPVIDIDQIAPPSVMVSYFDPLNKRMLTAGSIINRCLALQPTNHQKRDKKKKGYWKNKDKDDSTKNDQKDNRNRPKKMQRVDFDRPVVD